MLQLGFKGCHVIQRRRSLQACGDAGTLADRDPASMTIPDTCMSTLTLLQQLLRWTAAKVQQGGLRDPGGQAAAMCFAKGLLDSTCSQSPFAMPIWFNELWECQWPCLPEVPPDLNVNIVNGNLCLTEWVKMCSGDGITIGLAADWLRQLQSSMTDAHAPSLFGVLKHLAIDQACKGLFKQVLWSAALRIEQVIVHVISNPGTSTGNMIHAQTLDLLKFLWQPKQLSHELYKYVLSTKVASRPSACGPHYTFSTDKANVCGVNLANAIVGLPSNVAFQCVPQAMLLFSIAPISVST